MSFGNGIMEHTLAYRLWQRPFQEQKFAPIHRENDLKRVQRVLDVGCGPGTNTAHFDGSDYLGVDFNAGYIEYARRRHKRDFLVADIADWSMNGLAPFDFVFVNSFLHHVSDADTLRILHRLANFLAPDGYVHVLDLVVPERRNIAQLLARWDRGDYPRPLARWRELLSEVFEPVLFEPYRLTAGGVTLWNFVYFKGARRGVKSKFPDAPGRARR